MSSSPGAPRWLCMIHPRTSIAMGTAETPGEKHLGYNQTVNQRSSERENSFLVCQNHTPASLPHLHASHQDAQHCLCATHTPNCIPPAPSASSCELKSFLPSNVQASLPNRLWHTRHQWVPRCEVGGRNQARERASTWKQRVVACGSASVSTSESSPQKLPSKILGHKTT